MRKSIQTLRAECDAAEAALIEADNAYTIALRAQNGDDATYAAALEASAAARKARREFEARFDAMLAFSTTNEIMEG